MGDSTKKPSSKSLKKPASAPAAKSTHKRSNPVATKSSAPKKASAVAPKAGATRANSARTETTSAASVPPALQTEINCRPTAVHVGAALCMLSAQRCLQDRVKDSPWWDLLAALSETARKRTSATVSEGHRSLSSTMGDAVHQCSRDQTVEHFSRVTSFQDIKNVFHLMEKVSLESMFFELTSFSQLAISHTTAAFLTSCAARSHSSPSCAAVKEALLHPPSSLAVNTQDLHASSTEPHPTATASSFWLPLVEAEIILSAIESLLHLCRIELLERCTPPLEGAYGTTSLSGKRKPPSAPVLSQKSARCASASKASPAIAAARLGPLVRWDYEVQLFRASEAQLSRSAPPATAPRPPPTSAAVKRAPAARKAPRQPPARRRQRARSPSSTSTSSSSSSESSLDSDSESSSASGKEAEADPKKGGGQMKTLPNPPKKVPVGVKRANPSAAVKRHPTARPSKANELGSTSSNKDDNKPLWTLERAFNQKRKTGKQE